MIARMDTRSARDRARQQAAQMQGVLNGVLYQIIVQNARTEDPTATEGVLTVPFEELKDLPKNFQLQLQKTETAWLIKAVTPKNQNIVLPGQG